MGGFRPVQRLRHAGDLCCLPAVGGMATGGTHYGSARHKDRYHLHAAGAAWNLPTARLHFPGRDPKPIGRASGRYWLCCANAGNLLSRPTRSATCYLFPLYPDPGFW